METVEVNYCWVSVSTCVTLLATSKASLGELLSQIAFFFTKAGAFVFGSGLAIVPFLYGGVVKEYAWLNDHEFLDAVAVAMITPGPVVITVGFIGYIVTGREGGFLPGFLGASVAQPASPPLNSIQSPRRSRIGQRQCPRIGQTCGSR